jgi:peptidoglycan/LPS O-acetylase OafA/YrhL
LARTNEPNPHLDALRGAAALIVFAGHARELFIASPRAAAGLGAAAGSGGGTTVGHQAVMIFFVLSGYLVGGSVLRQLGAGRWGPGDYAARRLARLWTALLPALVIGWLLDTGGMALFGADSIYGGPAGQSQVTPDLGAHLSFAVFAGNALFLQEILVPALGTNVPLWSLSYEFWFYVLFPILVIASVRRTATAKRVAAIVALAAIGAFVGWHIAVYFLMWMLGAALEFLPRRLPARLAAALLPLAVVAFAVLNVALLKLRLNLFVSDFVGALGCAAMLWVVLQAGGAWQSRLYARIAHFIAEMSFTLYLVHLPALVFLSGLFVRPWERWPLDLSHIAIVVTLMALVFAYAYGLYLCFERRTPVVAAYLSRLLAGGSATRRAAAADPRLL